MFAFWLTLILVVPTNPEVLTLPVEQPLISTTTVSNYIHDNYSDIPFFYETLNCESRMDYSAVGDSGRSFGVAQIFLPAHPNITKKQALDAKWAIDWSAKQFREGNSSMWTCYRLVHRPTTELTLK